ncbi:low molecular weight protein-tyrosine-phosphatase [Sphingosinicella sp. LHD-64]|uniref:low molecular weight protein-tyrosine-phosphatase n=1 Tax=Sphingosinicella sp. LHD-64 TaxID=3072139 RepID=UPI00280D7499|nr:low molecular weight protein-tyrosine-phosphatase [Sphingosinicella sp. LHD-64]MDQ8757861.1 low molecular weight protein-tyrosine-phosphatase [Sphingosinicella sp. LHD-64]
MSTAVLFVCLGNICRFPLAEAALRAEAERRGLEVDVDSAGTGDWHVGHAPDPRAQAVARRNGLNIAHLRARQVSREDFDRFDHIIALDGQNLRNLATMQQPGSRAGISLLLDHIPGREGADVVDPYYGADAGFDVTWSDVTEGARALACKIMAGDQTSR